MHAHNDVGTEYLVDVPKTNEYFGSCSGVGPPQHNDFHTLLIQQNSNPGSPNGESNDHRDSEQPTQSTNPDSNIDDAVENLLTSHQQDDLMKQQNASSSGTNGESNDQRQSGHPTQSTNPDRSIDAAVENLLTGHQQGHEKIAVDAGIDAKPESIPVLDFGNGNVADIEDIMAEKEATAPRACRMAASLNETSTVDVEEDFEMVYDPSSFPIPISTTADDLVKQSDDDLSEDKPFRKTVCKSFSTNNFFLFSAI